ncbi:MAG: hypothetical protein DMG24_12165, partial [Acidobacteria bacterium]
FSESWALRAEGRLAEYLGAGFRPWTGELDAGWTPRDGSRVDLAAARLVIADNMAALRHHLQGNFTSAGITQSLDRHDTVSASLDATDWNQGNLRMRYRVDFAHHFEAVPGLEIEWPTLYQTYDRGFSFAPFSPRASLFPFALRAPGRTEGIPGVMEEAWHLPGGGGTRAVQGLGSPLGRLLVQL